MVREARQGLQLDHARMTGGQGDCLNGEGSPSGIATMFRLMSMAGKATLKW